MKSKMCVLLIIISICITVSGCSNNDSSSLPPPDITQGAPVTVNDRKVVDVDLTELSSTMVYSEVYNMVSTPENYVGKTVKMQGQFAAYHDESTGADYFACIISDATACCQQGLEFILNDSYSYPDDYPQKGSDVTVTGTFQTYQENSKQYCHLVSATIE